MVPVIHNDIALSIGLQNREEEHIIHVGGRHHPPTLADGAQGPDSNLLSDFCADYGLSDSLSFWRVGVREVGVEPMTKELLNHGDLALIRFGKVPDIRLTFGNASSGFP